MPVREIKTCEDCGTEFEVDEEEEDCSICPKCRGLEQETKEGWNSCDPGGR